MRIAKLAVEAATYAIDKPYSYLVPDDMDVSVGCRVLIPFGRGNRTAEGMVLALESCAPGKPLKSIRTCLDSTPVLSEKEIRLALWMRGRYFCTFYDALRTILPAGVWYRYQETWLLAEGAAIDGLGEKEAALCRFLAHGPQTAEAVRDGFGESGTALLYTLEKAGLAVRRTDNRPTVQDKLEQLVSLALPREEALARVEGRQKTAPRLYDAVSFLAREGETALRDLLYFTGVSRGTVTRLQKQGLLALRTQERYRISRSSYHVSADEIVLNDSQQQVFDDILARTESGEAGVTLLQGVTGSGKTLIYIRLAQALLHRGKNVMILVPEIVLTPQMMARFTAYFGGEVALLHSGLRLSERYDQWKRIRRGEVRIVLGTRSAVFAPLENLGLIVLDEEQEGSYESENVPCYHARDIAKYRCAAEKAQLLLGSATPTVESAYYARQGDYHLSMLTSRYNRRALPRVILADMRRELLEGNFTAVSRPLCEELRQNLERGEQSILFLNRRGNSRQLLCPQCGYVPQCPRCSVYLTYHSANDRLMCHYCGHSEKAPTLCPTCGGALRHIGFGTQKVEQELQALFPGTPILRMDADTVGEGHEALLRKFDEEKIPILLGTQMVAKGLDFENVTLVGVLSADMSLYVDHYRAAERSFSLLTQVVGRAGRGEKAGRAVIQTYTPANEVIEAAAAQDYERFYDSEIRLRRVRQDPPFGDLLVTTVTGMDESAVRRAVTDIGESLRAAAGTEPYGERIFEVLGPAPAPVVKVNNRYRYRLTVVGRNDAVLRRLLSSFMKEFARRSENRGMHIYTDCNLME